MIDFISNASKEQAVILNLDLQLRQHILDLYDLNTLCTLGIQIIVQTCKDTRNGDCSSYEGFNFENRSILNQRLCGGCVHGSGYSSADPDITSVQCTLNSSFAKKQQMFQLFTTDSILRPDSLKIDLENRVNALQMQLQLLDKEPVSSNNLVALNLTQINILEVKIIELNKLLLILNDFIESKKVPVAKCQDFDTVKT